MERDLVDEIADPDPADARTPWVRLAPTGVRLAETAVRAASAAQATALRDLPPAAARGTSSGAARDDAAFADSAAGGRPSAGEGR